MGRRKQGDEPRLPARFTLRESTIKALQEHSDETMIPMSPFVDSLIRDALKERLATPSPSEKTA